MFDRWEYTIPANTAEVDSKLLECKIGKGTLRDVVIYFPFGCQYLARCRVSLGEKQIIPRSSKNYLTGEGSLIPIRGLNEFINPNIPVLNWRLWNVDTKHDHTLWMSAEWSSDPEPFDKQSFKLLKNFVDILSRLIGVRSP